ncbi:SsrA-binding protein [Candidatus Peribacteria bacterium RIFCSPLOWO2_12_FULL_55_15]|nr:MAG: SsrA-binding protein [Candidatus Peribacteria bacterium RIFCSPHIGHO2_01_FULL_54_22]OGJ62885.1 MAG: SsrA-binding protein [Candidatus Peribacteria bacterium RIFCSPHIGHO2_02_FULL_55_24]OGJ65082.1 MAG: SsrA-binding protein [Candidatus Peribacteria bacterium RIFCSPHIGHO2_12_FULL_54_10]OGJ70515.1 MAG: SsrA-binding protein [Candidatus Peribacteria bacterium RIFCSPLOWO2_12_FULL_55_15]
MGPKGKTVAENRRARHDYDILKTTEAGIILTGSEVKSCRMGRVNIAGAYVSFFHGVPRLKGVNISLYPYARVPEYDPHRERELLLKKREAERLWSFAEQKGCTVIPLALTAGKYVKVLLGVAMGRKRYDKRQKIKGREIDRRLRHRIE